MINKSKFCRICVCFQFYMIPIQTIKFCSSFFLLGWSKATFVSYPVQIYVLFFNVPLPCYKILLEAPNERLKQNLLCKANCLCYAPLKLLPPLPLLIPSGKFCLPCFPLIYSTSMDCWLTVCQQTVYYKGGTRYPSHLHFLILGKTKKYATLFDTFITALLVNTFQHCLSWNGAPRKRHDFIFMTSKAMHKIPSTR